MPYIALFADYATSEAYPQWEGFLCRCGAADCRGQLHWDDWKKASVQEKYHGHFLKHVADKIEAFNAAAAAGSGATAGAVSE